MQAKPMVRRSSFSKSALRWNWRYSGFRLALGITNRSLANADNSSTDRL